MSEKLTLLDHLAARNPQRAFSRAQLLEAEGALGRAFKLFVIAARAGITTAEREVGLHYLAGSGVPCNAIEGARWLTLAAEKNDSLSQRHLGSLYMTGLQENWVRRSDAQLFTEPTNATADFNTALRFLLPPAEKGDAEAQAMAGYVYAAGPVLLRDAAQAKYWFGRAAESGQPAGHLGLGIITLPEADSDAATFAAVEHIRRAAEADLSSGHYYLDYLALIYENAIGVRADPVLAARHYGLAARAGIRNAQAKYGAMLFHGFGVRANRVEGESWLRRAGLNGDAQAAVFVAGIHARGGEMPANFSEAAAWLRIAAEAGEQNATHILGMFYLTGTGVPRDPDEAAIWLRRSAAAGDARAQSELAALLLSGRTNPQITEPAPVHEWFEKAAEAGDPVAAFNYAVCLAQGVGMARDDARAAHWFRRAAEHLLNAQYWYGRILAEGRGVAANPEEARFWLQKCADAELPEALADLGNMCLEGQGGPRDHAAGRQFFERAAKRGHAGSMFALGAMLGGGHDIPADRAASLAWYRQAAEKGHPMAALMLGRYLALGIATPVDPGAAGHWFRIAREAGIAEAQAELARLEPPADAA